MQYLYVCLFSNGHIKAGRSINPESRIAAHEARVSCLGVELVEHRVFSCASHIVPAEAELLRRCTEAAQKVNKNEWFVGLDFNDACRFAQEASLQEFDPSDHPLKAYLAFLTKEQREAFAAKCKTTAGHLRNIAYGDRPPSTELAVSIERESHMAVTRIEMFPDNYAEQWPELDC